MTLRGSRRVLVVAAVVVAAAAPARAQLYQWTDRDGTTRYTNDPATIPADRRPDARELGSPQSSPAPPRSAVESTVIPFTPGGTIKTAVSVNGTALTLVLDTGADRTVISPAALTRAGFDVDRGRTVEIIGATGRAPAREVVVPRVDVAGTRLGPLAVIAHDVGVTGVDGLLGRDVLDAFTLTVDAAGGRATLTPR